MNFYYFNDNADEHGYHEVHTDDCTFLPSLSNRTLIGYYSDCKAAIIAARIAHPGKKFDGCYFCCRECHRG